MIYQLREAEQAEKLNKRIAEAIAKQELIEVKVITKRSLNQNRYLHLLINFVAGEVGEDVQFIKESVFKIESNRDLFLVEYESPTLNKKVRYIRSTSDIPKSDLTTAIDNFRNFCALHYGIYLPAPDEEELVKSLMVEASKNGYI